MSKSNYTILVIDYEPRSIQAAKKTLEAAGYEVVVATDGLQGLTAFEQMKPGLVLIEAMIPKKHGFEVCQEIKKTPNGKTTPVVITTAVYRGRKYRTQALHIYGCDDYLEKPYPDDVLLKVCERFLGKPAGKSEEDEALATPMAASGGGGAVSMPSTPAETEEPPAPVAEAAPAPVQEVAASAAPALAPEPAEPVVPLPADGVTSAPSINDEISDRVDALLGGGLFDSPKEEPKPEPPVESAPPKPTDDLIDNVLQFESPAEEPSIEMVEESVDDKEDPLVETVEVAEATEVVETVEAAEDVVPETEESTDGTFDADALPETANTMMLERNRGLPGFAKFLIAVAVLAAGGAVAWMVWFQ